MSLTYIGNGFLAGVPARDLTKDESEFYGGVRFLVQSGLYLVTDKKRPAKPDGGGSVGYSETEQEVKDGSMGT